MARTVNLPSASFPMTRFAPFLVLLSLICGPAHAQSKNEELSRYRGPDREARLVERAKQEGRVVLYTSLAPTESKPLAEAFEKKYGVKVELWRALSDKVVQRVVTEGQAKRHTVDVVETNGPEMEMIAREKLFAPLESPYLADLPPQAVPSHRLWMPAWLRERPHEQPFGPRRREWERSEVRSPSCPSPVPPARWEVGRAGKR